MDGVKVGIIGCGFQGREQILKFAKRNIEIIGYDISKEALQEFEQELSASPKNRRYLKNIKLTANINEMANCDIVIENATENYDLKMRILKGIETVVRPDAIISSNSSSYITTELSEALEKKDRFINIHFIGVNWGVNTVEVVKGKHTSDKTITFVQDFLKIAEFNPVVINECPGFIYNRISSTSISNLFRAMEEYKLLDLDTLTRYIVYTLKTKTTVLQLDMLGIEVVKALLNYLKKNFGDRVYDSQYLEGRVQRKELGVKTGRGFYDYSDMKVRPNMLQRKIITNIKSDLCKIFVGDFHISQVNLISSLLGRGKQIYLDKIENKALSILQSIDPSQCERIKSALNLAQPNDRFDLVIENGLFEFPELIERLDALSKRFGNDVPILVNSPIYRLEDIAEATRHPSDMVFMMYTQKTYLANTELVKSAKVNKEHYERLKKLIFEFAGDCLEVNDGYGRPLLFMVLSKFFETARCIEEGIASKEDILVIMQQEPILRDLDYYGIDRLIIVAEYLYKNYGEPFKCPKIIYDMYKDGVTGIEKGQGFNSYQMLD